MAWMVVDFFTASSYPNGVGEFDYSLLDLADETGSEFVARLLILVAGESLPYQQAYVYSQLYAQICPQALQDASGGTIKLGPAMVNTGAASDAYAQSVCARMQYWLNLLSGRPRNATGSKYIVHSPIWN